MTVQGYFIVFGPLVLIAAAIIGGFILNSDLGGLLISLGVIGAVVWLFAAYRFLSAFNTDI